MFASRRILRSQGIGHEVRHRLPLAVVVDGILQRANNAALGLDPFDRLVNGGVRLLHAPLEARKGFLVGCLQAGWDCE